MEKGEKEDREEDPSDRGKKEGRKNRITTTKKSRHEGIERGSDTGGGEQRGVGEAESRKEC